MNADQRRLFVPNSVTAANIAVGFVSLIAASEGRFRLAVYLLMSAIVLDMADGILARKLHATSRFGQEMDSLGDALSFCAAPAFLVYQASLRSLEGVGVWITVVYVLAGVFRLARFNLTSDAHAKSRWTTGVPTPVGAGYLMVVALMADELPVAVAASVVLVMALLMASRFHLPELQGRGPVTVTLFVGLASFLAVLAWTNWYTIAWWNLWNVVILLTARAEVRRQERADEQSVETEDLAQV